MRRCFSVLLAAALAGCASSKAIQLDDGSTAYDVDCFNGRWACSDEASNVCGGGSYVVLDEDQTLGMLTQSKQGSMRIQCTADHDRARPADAPPPRASPVATCRAAFADAPATGKAWSAMRGRAPRETPPSRAEFVGACVALPANVQPCLRAAERARAGAACDRAMASLGAEAKNDLDMVFLAPASTAADAGAPPATQVDGDAGPLIRTGP